MSKEAEQLKLLIEVNRCLKQASDALAQLHLQVIAEIKNIQAKLEKLKSK